MLDKTSQGFRAFFLLQFTRELIKYSKGAEFIILKENENIESQKKEIKERVHDKLQEEKEIAKKPLILREINTLPRPAQRPIPPPQRQVIPQILRAPERLPPRLQYIQPVPTGVQIDLGKLNPVIQDPMVRSLECNGADQKIMVRGATNQLKITPIILNKEEIDQVIDKFSKASKIPVGEGVFRVVVGKLNLSAIISDIIGSKFIIKKLMLPRMPMNYMARRPRNIIR